MQNRIHIHTLYWQRLLVASVWLLEICLAAGQNPGRSTQLDSLDGGRGPVRLVVLAPVAELEFAPPSSVAGVLAI